MLYSPFLDHFTSITHSNGVPSRWGCVSPPPGRVWSVGHYEGVGGSTCWCRWWTKVGVWLMLVHVGPVHGWSIHGWSIHGWSNIGWCWWELMKKQVLLFSNYAEVSTTVRACKILRGIHCNQPVDSEDMAIAKRPKRVGKYAVGWWCLNIRMNIYSTITTKHLLLQLMNANHASWWLLICTKILLDAAQRRLNMICTILDKDPWIFWIFTKGTTVLPVTMWHMWLPQWPSSVCRCLEKGASQHVKQVLFISHDWATWTWRWIMNHI